MASIDKGDVTRGGVGIGKVGLCDAVTECGSGCIMDDAENIQVCDSGGVDDGTTLEIGVPSWDGDDDVRNV